MRAVSRLLAGAVGAREASVLEVALVEEARALTGVAGAVLLEAGDSGVELKASDPPTADLRAIELDELPAVRSALDDEGPLRLDPMAAAALSRSLGLAFVAEAALLVPARTGRYVLLLADGSPERIAALDDQAAVTFVSAAAIGLGQVNLLERHAVQTERQAALARAAKALNESLDLARVLPRICDEAAAILDADSVCVYRGSSASRLVLEASNASPERVGDPVEVEVEVGLAARAFALDRPLMANAPESGVADPLERAEVRGELAVPMRWDGELRGVLWVGYRRERRVTDDDLSLLQSFGDLAAVACRNASVHSGLAEAARTDALTGCLNHAALQDTLRRELQRSRRTGRRLSVVMVDLDHFKDVNESRGHLMGDEVLRRVGRALREAVRPYDFVARYGGDEFAIIAVDAGEERAAEIAERAIARLGAALDQTLGGSAGPHATAGVAEWRGAASPSELIRDCDRALLFGKQQGVRGQPVRSTTVPHEFTLGRPAAAEDAVRGDGPGPAPWPSAVRRETEPLRRHTRELTLATAIGARLGEMTRTAEIVQATAEQVRGTYGWSHCAVISASDGLLHVVASAPPARAAPSEVAEKALREGASVRSGDLPRPRGAVTRIDEPRSELAVPIRLGDTLWGVLSVQDAARDAFADSDARLLETVADQLGSALHAAAAYERLEVAYFDTVEALAAALEGNRVQRPGEARDVAARAEEVGRRLGLEREALRELRYAAVLRNVGQAGVPDALLAKPGPLTDGQRSAVERHALNADRLLAQVAFLDGARMLVRHSHERWDGRGYPDGLAGEQIPLGARVLAVCDAYEAMTSDRPYRGAMPEALARAELTAGAGSQFDPRVVSAALAVVAASQAPAA